MLVPPVMEIPLPTRPSKGSGQKAYSPRSRLPSRLCQFGINHIFLSASAALTLHLHHSPYDIAVEKGLSSLVDDKVIVEVLGLTHCYILIAFGSGQQSTEV